MSLLGTEDSLCKWLLLVTCARWGANNSGNSVRKWPIVRIWIWSNITKRGQNDDASVCLRREVLVQTSADTIEWVPRVPCVIYIALRLLKQYNTYASHSFDTKQGAWSGIWNFESKRMTLQRLPIKVVSKKQGHHYRKLQSQTQDSHLTLIKWRQKKKRPHSAMNCLFPLQKETTLVQLIKKKPVFLHFAKTMFTLQISNQLKNRLGTTAFGNVWQPTSG